MKWHAIFKEDGKMQDCEFIAPSTFEEAENVFCYQHPKATYWELGMPLVEIEYDDPLRRSHNGEGNGK